MSTNYSKWDAWAAEASSSDDDDEVNSPTVTTLEEPMSVTFGGKQSDIIAKPIDSTESLKKKTIESSLMKENAAAALAKRFSKDCSVESQSKKDIKSGNISKAFMSDAYSVFNAITRNGSVTKRYLWGQDRRDCIISCFIPPNIRGKDISVVLVNKKLSVRVNSKEHTCLKLAYDINTDTEENKAPKYSSDSSGEVKVFDDLDWEVITVDVPAVSLMKINEEYFVKSGKVKSVRVVKITVEKSVPVPGTNIWWSNVVKGEGEIDVSVIPDRCQMKNRKNYQQVWDEAHRLFREKVKNSKKIEI